MTVDIERYLLDDQRWLRLLSPISKISRPGLFLDRDGVMLEEREYLTDPADVALIPGCSTLIRHARTLGIAVVVVTNQSGIGRGYSTWRDYASVENRMLELLARAGARVDAVLANAATPCDKDCMHNWRKPEPGMLTTAAAALNADLAQSLVVGDKASDLKAGRAAGLFMGVHVLTGHGRSEIDAAQRLDTADFKVILRSSIVDVIASSMPLFRSD